MIILPITLNEFNTILYPHEASGWKNGVYHPRIPMYTEKNLFLNRYANAMEIKSRIWRETDPTEQGIYLYEETAEYTYPAGNGLYYLQLTFVNPTDTAYDAYLRVNGIIKKDAITVQPGEEITCQVFTSIMHDTLKIRFLHNRRDHHDNTLSQGSVYLQAIHLIPQPIRSANQNPTVYLASDSTVMTYSPKESPQAGWGQLLPEYLNLPIVNHAIGGRSSKSFIEENRLDSILEAMNEKDYLFVQFGHNDATKTRPNRYVSVEDFSDYIEPYIIGCQLTGAHCVLVTPVARRNCDEYGAFRISFNEYRQKMFDLAECHDLPLLDLGKASWEFLNTLDHETSKAYYMWINPGEYPGKRYLEGLQDNTHLNKKGAAKFARILAGLISDYMKDDKLNPIKKAIKQQL